MTLIFTALKKIPTKEIISVIKKKHNPSKEERAALKTNTDLVILPANKGNATVIPALNVRSQSF